MFLLNDIITYVRRLIKSPSDAVITDNLIIDYINRFYMTDVDPSMQLFDFKTKYQFQTTPGVDRYNMPLYNVQVEQGSQNIGMYPVYQGFISPAYISGIEVALHTQKRTFFNIFPNIVQNLIVVGTGDGTNGPYTLQIPLLANSVPLNPPVTGLIRGHVDITGIMALGTNVDPPIADNVTATSLISRVPVTSVDSAVFFTSLDANGANVVVQDSGIFFRTDNNLGLLINPGKAPNGNTTLSGGYSAAGLNCINYLTGQAIVTFPQPIPQGTNINAQVYYFQAGLPRAILYYNNTLTLRMPPAYSYLVEMDAYLSPAAFLTSSAALPFAYMAEYIARGAARKILSDTGDIEQFQFYEPLFKEQEQLVWKRSQRQWTNNRTETIYSRGQNWGYGYSNNFIGGSF